MKTDKRMIRVSIRLPSTCGSGRRPFAVGIRCCVSPRYFHPPAMSQRLIGSFS